MGHCFSVSNTPAVFARLRKSAHSQREGLKPTLVNRLKSTKRDCSCKVLFIKDFPLNIKTTDRKKKVDVEVKEKKTSLNSCCGLRKAQMSCSSRADSSV